MLTVVVFGLNRNNTEDDREHLFPMPFEDLNAKITDSLRPRVVGDIHRLG